MSYLVGSILNQREDGKYVNLMWVSDTLNWIIDYSASISNPLCFMIHAASVFQWQIYKYPKQVLRSFHNEEHNAKLLKYIFNEAPLLLLAYLPQEMFQSSLFQ